MAPESDPPSNPGDNNEELIGMRKSDRARGGRGDPTALRPPRSLARRLPAHRMTALVALLTLVPLGVLTFATFTLSSNAVAHEVRDKVQATAALESQALAVQMDGIRSLVTSFAVRSSVVEALGDGTGENRDLAALQERMDEFLAADAGFAFASVLDPSGRLIAVSPPTPSTIGVDYSYRDWYRGVTRTGEPYVSEAYQTAAAGEPLVVAVVAPVRAGGAGTPILGYLNVGYRLAAIQEYVQAFEQDSAVTLVVTDQRGVIIAAPRQPPGLVSAADDPRVLRALAGESGTLSVDQAGGRVLSGFEPVSELGWTVHADARQSEAFAPVSRLRTTVGWIGGALAAALVVGSVLVGRLWRARENAERRERQAAQYSRGLIEASLDPLVVISPDGVITDVNEAATTATGAPREGLIGSDLAGYFTEPDTARDGNRRAFAGGHIAGVPLSIRHRDGHLIDVLYNASVYRDAAGEVKGALAAARDVTDRNHAEAEVARRAHQLEELNGELARSNGELERFAYVASHDLSEPLRAISGPISLLARRYQDQLDAEADQFIGFAVDGCERMQKIIDDLLTYSRVGRMETRFGPVDCNAVVNTALTVLGPAIMETGASITVGPLPVVTGEATQLTLLFQNLLANSLKFVAGDVVPEVAVAAERSGAAWRFTVTDNGIGIEPRHRERIFGMFKRLHAREDYPGTGIGLALAEKIVARHSGQIGVEDTPTGRGSRFWFTLPGAEAR